MYPATARTTATRHLSRVTYQRTEAHRILDEAYHCCLAFVADNAPRALPTLHVRIDETLYLHGSTASTPLLAARDPQGLAVCVAVTLLDGLVYARAQAHHSANYRSVVVHGTARLVSDPADKRRALDALIDKAAPGRAADSRPPTSRELAQTAVLAVALDEVSVKARAGDPVDEQADLALPYWAGVVPMRTVADPPQSAAGVTRAVPTYFTTSEISLANGPADR
ncbi:MULTISPECIES: pyridoxamine 5'-phosphate oxidase family protein [unclassified Micromonospora]|uniref:pyridoxamine 5'-phosphate oxidase family protein n=1 Tax=unclassified Micromonospora TaxID=2617518 RepID=UPI003A8B0AF0